MQQPSVVSSKQFFNKMLRWQSVAICIMGLVAFFYAGKHAALSLLIGGFSLVVASFFAARIADRSKYAKAAATALVNILIAEVVKIFLVCVFLTIAFLRYQQLVPIALIIGLMVAAMIVMFAMHKMKSETEHT